MKRSAQLTFVATTFGRASRAPIRTYRHYGPADHRCNHLKSILVRSYNALNRPNKKKNIARDGAYYGVTVASGSLIGLTGMHKSFDLPYIEVLRVKAPHVYWAEAEGKSEGDFCNELVADVEDLVTRHGTENIAAFSWSP